MSTLFKYILDRSGFGHSPKKFECPGCSKKTFVRYIDSETGDYIEYDFGRCDRENNCGYFKTPNVNDENGIIKNEYKGSYITPEITPTYHDADLVSKAGREFKNNNFIQFLKGRFTTDEVKKAILLYLIGTSNKWEGSTVFWQIDNHNKVRGGKILLYLKETGKRYKDNDGRAYISWVHRALKLDEFNLKQCLFGLHLINEGEANNICLVEGEKTAILMSIFKPEYIWMATGSKNGFKREMLQPIKDYKITAFPDKGEFEYWNKIAIDHASFGYKITVSSLVENSVYPEGTDLADIYLELNESEPAKQEIDLSKYTHTEAEVYRLTEQNPALRFLINTFDLTDNVGKEIRQIM